MKFRLSRWLIAIFVLIVSAIGVLGYRLSSVSADERIQSFLTSIQGHGPSGWIVIALLQALIAASGVVPAAAMGAAAGAIYGVWIGFSLTAIGTMVGATVSFLLARSVFRPLISSYLLKKPYMARLDRSISNEGWRVVCLLRLSPVMPFAAGSYALGLTSINLSSYLAGSIAALPALLGYVFLGHLAQEGLSDHRHGTGWLNLAFLGLGILATLLFILHIGTIVRRTSADRVSVKDD